MKYKLQNIVEAIKSGSTLSGGLQQGFENDVPMFQASQQDPASNKAPAISESDEQAVRDSIRSQVVQENLPVGVAPSEEDMQNAERIADKMSAGIEAAKVAFFATQNSNGYAQRAATFKPHSSGDTIVGNSTGIEAFEVQEFDKFHDQSVRFNLHAAQQSDFAALFAPLLVGSADMNDWKISIDRVVFGHFAEHSIDRDIVDAQDLKPLQTAYSDVHALKNTATDLVPYVTEASKSAFMSTSLVEHVLEDLDGTKFPSAPLKTGTEQRLIALSQHPGRKEAYTRNAIIHKQIRLSELIVTVESEDGSEQEAFAFKTNAMPRTLFNSYGQGNSQETQLSFRNDNFGIGQRGQAKKNAKGDTTSTLLETHIAGGNLIKLSINSSGYCKHALGTVTISGHAEIVGYYTEDGTQLPIPEELKKLKLTVSGFKVKARTTNSDLAHISIIADMVTESDICRIGLRPPVVAHSSLIKNRTGSLSEQQLLDVLIEMCKVEMANDAILSFLDYFDTVREYCAFRNSDDLDEDFGDLYEPDAIAGIGRKVIRPECIEYDISDLADKVNSISSADKVTDVRRYVSGVLGDIVSSLIQNSRIQTALPIYAPHSEVMGKIVTSPRINNFLMIEGDPRLAGNSKYQVVSSPATILTDTFYIQLSIDNAKSGELNPLNSGQCLYIAPQVGTFPVKRGSSTNNELAVQAQYEHIYNVPALAKVTIKGLSEFIREKTRLETLTEVAGVVQTEEQTTP